VNFSRGKTITSSAVNSAQIFVTQFHISLFVFSYLFIYFFQLPSSAIDDLEVSGDDLNIHEIDKSISGNTFVIKGVKFEGSTLGPKELCIKWKELTEYVRLHMVAGTPAKLSIPGWDLTQAS
jgi:hypothetical protein